METAIAFLVRLLLVLLFLPFSATDKIVNFSGAVAHPNPPRSAYSRFEYPDRRTTCLIIVIRLSAEHRRPGYVV